MEQLKELMSLPRTEVLLFLPLFHSYRFAGDKSMSVEHQTRIFIENFTTKGIADYDNVMVFMDSVKEKLKTELNLNYVRPLLLDDGGQKNLLILLTKHRNGMLLMNKIADQMTTDSKSIKVKNLFDSSMFSDKDMPPKHAIFRRKVVELLKSKNRIENKNFVEFTIIEGLLPKHLMSILKELKQKKLILCETAQQKEITNSNQWNIAENITKSTFIKWIQP